MPVFLVPILSALGGALGKIALNMVASVATQDFLEWALKKVGRCIVDHTDTPHDNEWFDAMVKAYESHKPAAQATDQPG